MKLLRLLEFLHSHLKAVVRVSIAILVLLVVADAIPGLVNKHEAHTAIERIPGFWSVFGFVGCALLIIGSKAFGHCGIMKREDYYDE